MYYLCIEVSELEHSLLTVVIHEQKYSHRVWDQIVLDTTQNRVCREKKMDYHFHPLHILGTKIVIF